MQRFSEDLHQIIPLLADIPMRWDGKSCVLEMKERNFQWRQMEWWAFYFELLCRDRLSSVLRMPGDRYNSVQWDATGRINWDFKSKAIKTDTNSFILNDQEAMNASVETHGEHGLIVCLCDVEYNDKDRTFQRWREELAGGRSAYQQQREKRTSNSRYRKVLAVPVELVFMRFDAASLSRLGTMRQGRTSNGKPRPVKYSVNLEQCTDLIAHVERIGEPLE
ncbi:MAG: hypothetical protein KIT88_09280 [Phycisphaeraceae bacterium]|nr:hypothetical protein [Phycisphaeraceae bacterium]